MSSGPKTGGKRSNAYELFILVLTVMSLVMHARHGAAGRRRHARHLLQVLRQRGLRHLPDRLRREPAVAPTKNEYLFRGRGWLDLLGSIPSLGSPSGTGLLRLARLSSPRTDPAVDEGRRAQERPYHTRRHREPWQYAIFITILSTIIVLRCASVLVLQFESRVGRRQHPDRWDAFWYALVTLTTVGYGDYYPVRTVFGTHLGDVHHVRRRGDHRRPRQHPRQRAGPAAKRRGGSPTRFRRPARCTTSSSRSRRNFRRSGGRSRSAANLPEAEARSPY